MEVVLQEITLPFLLLNPYRPNLERKEKLS